MSTSRPFMKPTRFKHKNKFINMDFGPKRLSNNKVTISLLYQPIIQYIESLYDNNNRFCQIKNMWYDNWYRNRI